MTVDIGHLLSAQVKLQIVHVNVNSEDYVVVGDLNT